MDVWPGLEADPVTLHKYLYANVDPVSNIDPSGYITMGSLLTGLNTASNLYTAGTVAVNILTGNYLAAAGTVAEEVVFSKLGFLGRPVAKLSNRALRLFYRIWGRSVKLTLGAGHSPRVLGRNLEAVGATRPPNTAAHHIVAGNSPKARAAQRVLDEHGIDINSPTNGVFLPNSRSSDAFGALHTGGHTDDYFELVNERIVSASASGNKIDVLNELGRIKIDLLTEGIQVQNKLR